MTNKESEVYSNLSTDCHICTGDNPGLCSAVHDDMKPPTPPVRSQQTKEAFIKYLAENPQERFWQAVRNFSGEPFVLAGDLPFNKRGEVVFPDVLEDTFYREEL